MRANWRAVHLGKLWELECLILSLLNQGVAPARAPNPEQGATRLVARHEMRSIWHELH